MPLSAVRHSAPVTGAKTGTRLLLRVFPQESGDSLCLMRAAPPQGLWSGGRSFPVPLASRTLSLCLWRREVLSFALPGFLCKTGELSTRDDFSIVFLFRLYVYKFKKTHKSVSPLTGRFLPRGGPRNVVFPSFVRCHWRRWSCGLAQPQHTLRLDVLGAKGILLPWAEFK